MPRIARKYILPDGEGVFHVICRGNNGIDVFRDDFDRRFFVSLVARAKKEFGLEIFNWALLGTHYHLMMRILDSLGLSSAMKFINQRYGQYFRSRYAYRGHLWESRFTSIPVTDDAHLLVGGIYIDLNAVRAGMVRKPEDWAWSSAQRYVTGVKDGLTDDSPIFLELGKGEVERRVCYKQLLADWILLPPIRDF